MSQIKKTINWDRWHDLLDIKVYRAFTPNEQAEYNGINTIAQTMDQVEVNRCQPELDRLINYHEQVINELKTIRELLLKK